MDKSDENLLQKCAQDLIELTLDTTGHELVYERLAQYETEVKERGFREFCAAYVPFKLTLGCIDWTVCCNNHHMHDKLLQNFYFRKVMQLFKTPQMLDTATRFGECLYASNAGTEDSPVLAALAHLFYKLGLAATSGPSQGDNYIKPGFQFMVEVSEAFKTVFESRFDEFFFAHKDLEATRP